MTGGQPGRRRGRRDNGLDAAEFRPAGDVDPRVGEHLLDVLGLAGIAAYLAPATDLNPVTRASTPPSRPVDRLWVDRTQLDRAQALIAELDEPADTSRRTDSPDDAHSSDASSDVPDTTTSTGDGTGTGRSDSATQPVRRDGADRLDFDALWQDIIAGYDREAPDVDPPNPGGPADRPTGPPSSDRHEPNSAHPTAKHLTAKDPSAPDPSAPDSTAGDADRTNSPTSDGNGTHNGKSTGRTGDHTGTDDKTGELGIAEWPTSDRRGSNTHESDSPNPEPHASEPLNSEPHGSEPLSPEPRRKPEPIVGLDTPFGTDVQLPTDPEDRFVPPPPPPLPRPSRYAVLAVTLIVVGAFLVLFQGRLLPIGDTLALVLGFAGIAGGFAIGVWRLREGDADDDPDDGAQV